jgi:hypothetical protein
VDVASVQKAIALDPANAELHYRAGMLLSNSLSDSARTEGLKQLLLAAHLVPEEARYWSDLAWACELAGDAACATQGVEQAVKLSPNTPQLRWIAANTLLRAGQNDAAMAEFSHLLEMDPSYAPATFHICMSSIADPQVIIQKVLPPGKDPTLKVAYLEFLMGNEAWDEAHKVWRLVAEAGTPVPMSLAAPYIEQLLQRNRFDEAEEVWRDLENSGVLPKPPTGQESNLVFNGNFGQMPMNSGFDWRIRPAPYIALDFADPNGYSGKRCLRVDFAVSRNEEYAPLSQLIPVASRQAYQLTAYVRSQDITSDSGPRFEIRDPVHPAYPSVQTDSTVGTTPWHQISANLCTGPETKLVLLSLVRVRGRTYPTEITGSFWLDSVVLKLLASGTGGACGAPAH